MSNGHAERIAGSVKGAARKMVLYSETDWDKSLPVELEGYRYSKISTGVSPF